MDELLIRQFSIFNPYYLKKAQELEQSHLKLVQYTSAEAALSIIGDNEVWLRNTSCMNDYSEVEHGYECLLEAIHSKPYGEKFKNTLESLFPDAFKKLADLFDGWTPFFKSGTFIACVSEHPPEEDKYGRLSMWRAYGGKHSVALVLNTTPFLSESDALHAYTNPVLYCDKKAFTRQLGELGDRLLSVQTIIKLFWGNRSRKSSKRLAVKTRARKFISQESLYADDAPRFHTLSFFRIWNPYACCPAPSAF